jgi:hypothetical protein
MELKLIVRPNKNRGKKVNFKIKKRRITISTAEVIKNTLLVKFFFPCRF